MKLGNHIGENRLYGKTFKWENFRGCAQNTENFCSASGSGHHVPYIASDSRGKLLRSAKKPRKLQKFCRIR